MFEYWYVCAGGREEGANGVGIVFPSTDRPTKGDRPADDIRTLNIPFLVSPFLLPTPKTHNSHPPPKKPKQTHGKREEADKGRGWHDQAKEAARPNFWDARNYLQYGRYYCSIGSVSLSKFYN